MNFERLDKSDSWINAVQEVRDGFCDAMTGKQYGASETLNAWLWFYEGWCAHVSLRIDEEYNR